METALVKMRTKNDWFNFCNSNILFLIEVTTAFPTVIA